MIDINEFCSLIESKLYIETDDCDYVGVLKFTSISTNQATFEQAYELPSRDYCGTMHILISSVLSFRVLKPVDENFEISNFDSSEKIVHNPLKITDINTFCSVIHSKLYITTDDGNYVGVLKFISISDEKATFEHMYELPTHNYLGTVHMLFSSILSFRVLKPVDKNFEISNFDSSEKIVHREFIKILRIDSSKIVDMAKHEHFMDYLPTDLKDNCPAHFCIVDSLESIFYDCVKCISESAIIGASFHGPRISRSGVLTWLCLSTSTCVFVFDIEKLGASAFTEGLKQILESDEILKVIHDCREVSDCVFHLFDTEIKPVFDTQVTDYMINMQMCTGKKMFKYVNSLDSCLYKYLSVPQELLYNRNKSKSYDDEVTFYHKRPLDMDFIRVLMKSSMYLPYLKEKQEKLLMSPFEKAVDVCLNSARSACNFELAIMRIIESMNANTIEDSFEAPLCLLESVKSIRFCDSTEE